MENVEFRVRLVDCVGYTVNGAVGYMDEHGPRMVITPWSPEPVTFQAAAEMGTRKVIRDHSTIGLVVTTDGSITEIPRETTWLPRKGSSMNWLSWETLYCPFEFLYILALKAPLPWEGIGGEVPGAGVAH